MIVIYVQFWRKFIDIFPTEFTSKLIPFHDWVLSSKCLFSFFKNVHQQIQTSLNPNHTECLFFFFFKSRWSMIWRWKFSFIFNMEYLMNDLSVRLIYCFTVNFSLFALGYWMKLFLIDVILTLIPFSHRLTELKSRNALNTELPKHRSTENTGTLSITQIKWANKFRCNKVKH